MRNMTQKELAGGRYSISYISALERERVKPTPGMLKWCAQRLGVPLASLLGESGVAGDETEPMRVAARQGYEQVHAQMLMTGGEIARGRAELDEVRRRMGASAPRSLQWFAAYGACLEGDTDAALRDAEAYLHDAEAEQDERGRAAAHWLFGRIYAGYDVVRAVAEYQRALEMEDRAYFDLDAAITIRSDLSHLLLDLGDVSAAAALNAQALRAHEDFADPAARAERGRTLAEEAAQAGNWQWAYRLIRWAWLSQREVTAHRMAARSYLRRALFAVSEGGATPEYELRQALVLADQARDEDTRLLAAGCLALTFAERGEQAEARQVIGLNPLPGASDPDDPPGRVDMVIQMALSWIARAEGDDTGARAYADAAEGALAGAAEQERLFGAAAYTALSRLYEALDDPTRALRALRRAVAVRAGGPAGALGG